MVKRTTDHRDSYKLDTPQKVSPNYYPVDSAIMIEDTSSNIQMAVINDRSEGGSAYKKGRIELLIDRRVYEDDDLGMCQSLLENDLDGSPVSITASYYMQFTSERAKSFVGI